MGGCATKPKVLKADETEALAPVVNEDFGTQLHVSNPKEQPLLIDDDQDKEILSHDDQGINRRSLSNLFKENKEKKDINENDEKSSEQIKKEDLLEIGNATVPSEAQPQEVEKAETLVFYDAVKAETEKPIEATENTQAETPEEKKPTTEIQTPETLEEKRTVDEKSAVETEKIETPDEKQTIEEKLVTESETPGKSEKKTDVAENV